MASCRRFGTVAVLVIECGYFFRLVLANFGSKFRYLVLLPTIGLSIRG